MSKKVNLGAAIFSMAMTAAIPMDKLLDGLEEAIEKYRKDPSEDNWNHLMGGLQAAALKLIHQKEGSAGLAKIVAGIHSNPDFGQNADTPDTDTDHPSLNDGPFKKTDNDDEGEFVPKSIGDLLRHLGGLR